MGRGKPEGWGGFSKSVIFGGMWRPRCPPRAGSTGGKRPGGGGRGGERLRLAPTSTSASTCLSAASGFTTVHAGPEWSRQVEFVFVCACICRASVRRADTARALIEESCASLERRCREFNDVPTTAPIGDGRICALDWATTRVCSSGRSLKVALCSPVAGFAKDGAPNRAGRQSSAWSLSRGHSR